jgi:hypothetical protein
MEKEFATYEQAFKLKELGFDEPCLGWFMKINPLGKEFRPDIKFDKVLNQNQVSVFGNKNCSAPLKQQAISFLLNKCDEDGTETSIEYFGDESGSVNRHLGFGTLWDAIQILISLIEDKS